MTRRRRALLAATLGLIVFAPGASAATPRTCEQDNIVNAIRDAGESKGAGFHQLICRDVNGDGKKDALFSLLSGGTAGPTQFGVVDGESNILQFLRDGYKLSMRVVGNKRFDVQQPIFKKGDPNCCPSRFGFTVYKWNGTTFKAHKGKTYGQPKNFVEGRIPID